jgi:hypothetical protein
MSNFLDKFPLVRYTVDKSLLSERDTVTNILFRVGIIKEVMETNVDSYQFYSVRDGDRPETLADRIYGTPEAHWVILYANNIYDPYYDWPMDDRTFQKYIIKKYGSIEWAKTNYHHYEKVITRENPLAQVVNTTRFVINDKKLTDGILTLDAGATNFSPGEIAFVGPSNATNTFSGEVIAWNSSNGQIVLANTSGQASLYQYLIGNSSSANGSILSIDLPTEPMDAYNTLTDTTDFSTYTVAGRTVFETISRDRVTYYDYEEKLNDDKRLIKIIRPRYYNQLVSELENLTNQKVFLRRP